MIWVIGAKGMLGTEVCRQLSERKMSFVATGREVSVTDSNAMDRFIQTTETQKYLESHNSPEKDPDNGKIKWIINCSAYTAVDKAEEEPEAAAEINNKGALNIARTARNHGAKLIHISTDYVFDGKATSPITETEKKNPCGVYGKTKSDGEDQIISSMTQYYILRTSWLYGFDGKNFVYTMTKLFNTKDELKVVSDQKGTPTFCGDLANAIITIIERSYKASGFFGKNSIPTFGIYNFSNKGETNWYEFANAIKEIGEKTGKIQGNCKLSACTTAEYGAKAPRPAYSVLDKSKIEKELKIKIPEWKVSLAAFFKNKRFNLI